MEEQKLCRDCRHCRPDRAFLFTHGRWEFAKCGHPVYGIKSLHPVSGRKRYQYAELQRQFEGVDYCGKDAKGWEPKE